ncbi:5780_t:CDS:2, partial [Dentiscutata heterogama]
DDFHNSGIDTLAILTIPQFHKCGITDNSSNSTIPNRVKFYLNIIVCI